MGNASDPARREVFVLFRPHRLPPTDLSFHRVADCTAVVAARAEADERGEARELAAMPLEEAAALDASEREDCSLWGTLRPCRECWPAEFVDAVYESDDYQEWLDRARGRAVHPALVVGAAREHLRPPAGP